MSSSANLALGPASLPRSRVVELLAEQSVLRMRITAAAFGLMFFVGEVLRLLLPGKLELVLLPPLVGWSGALLCGLLFWLLQTRKLKLARQILAGEIFLFSLSLLLSLGESLQSENEPNHGLSRAVLVVMLVPVCLPSGVKRALGLCVLLVAAQPLSQFLLVQLGYPSPTWEEVWIPLGGDLLAVAAATLPAMAISQLNSKALDSYELGNYRLLERLSQGGMGEVWVAQHRLLKRPAAIKLTRVNEELGLEWSDVVFRFEREAQVLSCLQSPHTVRVYDYGEELNGRLYLVMERLQGLDLDRLVKQFGPLPPSRVVRLLFQCCASLLEAHSHGLVHRDVKPANLFLTYLPGQGDFLKVLDFGLVSPHGLRADRHTANNQVLGTPGYLSPEQISGKGFDPRSDIYSLGCVAFWLLTGKEVFEASTYAQVLTAHLHENPPRPSWRIDRPIPRELDLLVERCLQKEPEQRPADISELIGCLEQVPSGDEPWDKVASERRWEQFSSQSSS